MQKVRDSKAFCYAAFVRCAKKWGESYINYGEKYLEPGKIKCHNRSTAAERPAMKWHIWEGKSVPNGIYIQTEYHGKLIRKIVCNGDERWFIGSNCAVTFLSMTDCMAAIDRL